MTKELGDCRGGLGWAVTESDAQAMASHEEISAWYPEIEQRQ